MNGILFRFATLGIVWLAWAAMTAGQSPQSLPHIEPEAVGLDATHLDRIDALVAYAIDTGQMPGCVVTIGHRGRIVFQRAYGHRQVLPEPKPMTVDTVFDLASLTKPIATATSVMILVEQGRVRLRDPVSRYLPEFGQNGKEDVTVEQLLTHQGGLIPDNALADYRDGPEEAFRRIYALELQYEPGSRFVYTDVGFLVLGALVERVSGLDVHEFSQRHIFDPLGMHDTGYLPDGELRERAAATEQRDDEWMVGEVHDPRAYLLGGVAGHAGLFSTADDLAVYAQMMLRYGRAPGQRILYPATVEAMTQPREVSSGKRALGWDKQTRFSSNRGEFMTERAFGHGGFTGTAIWIDPGRDLFVIFLSNRLHPDGEGSVNRLAGTIGTIAVTSMYPPPHARPDARPAGDVLAGIDVLVRDEFAPLQGKTIGLITNQTGRDRNGRATVRILADAPDVELAVLFSPEHGLEGILDQSQIADSEDPRTGLRVVSLYGETRRPTPESVAGLDALVFDIQDIGTRFYTYISTMGLAMEVAAEHDLEFYVLDRPNPITGRFVDGPVLPPGEESFIGFHTIPVRHGMTAGELARMMNDERGWGAALHVIPIDGWRRDMFFDETGLPWTNPSPNMRNLNQAVLYPGIGLLETTNLSVGRGTDTPFEILGAPWMDGQRVAESLRDYHLPGVAFVPTSFTPDASKFANETCSGIHILITDRARLEPIRTGLAIACVLRDNYPQEWNSAPYARLLSHPSFHLRFEEGVPLRMLEQAIDREVAEFLPRRARYLLY